MKNDVLNFLELNRGKYLSGAKIASALGVSRNAVWKQVRALEKDGYQIEKRTNLGYKLLESNDMVSAQGIDKYLDKGTKAQIEVYQSLGSTNDFVISRAQEGAKEGLVAVALSQESGKGRLGRTFFSKGGVYFSILLRPNSESGVREYLTVLSALAVCESIRDLFNVNAGIKWVNDVYIDGKKCAGILTEASIDFELGSLSYAVVGIGINVCEPSGGFPLEIKDVATAINKDIPDRKNKLIAMVLNKLEKNYYGFNREELVRRYKEASIMTQKKVLVKNAGVERTATCLGIDDECRLIVRYEGGEEEKLYYGEVSLCLKD